MNSSCDEQHERLRQLDRLVDGELSEAERRELLLALEREPEGWRRCALAFLEAQSWGSTIRRLGSSDVAEPVEPAAEPKLVPAAASPSSLRQATTWLAMAASVVICFGLGLAADRWWGAEPSSPERPFQVAGGERPVAPANGQPGGFNFVAGGNRPDDHHQPNRQRPWQFDAPAVPQQVVDVLERLGSRVTQEREFFPVPLDDGRKVIVPVDRIELTPANLRDFQ